MQLAHCQEKSRGHEPDTASITEDGKKTAWPRRLRPHIYSPSATIRPSAAMTLIKTEPETEPGNGGGGMGHSIALSSMTATRTED